MVEIKVDEGLWRSVMAPEGLLERWLVADGARVAAGQAVAGVRIEDALHELITPAAGRLVALAAEGDLVEPGSIVARVDPPGAAAPPRRSGITPP